MEGYAQTERLLEHGGDGFMNGRDCKGLGGLECQHWLFLLHRHLSVPCGALCLLAFRSFSWL